MYKKFRRLCAWALAVITVLSVVPASGIVMADEKTADATEVKQGTVYFKVPNADGKIIIQTSDESSKQTLTVTDEKTTLTDKDGNTSDVTLTEEGYCLELTEDVGTVIETEVIPSEGYEVGTYHILSDTGDEVENKSLSSDNKYEVTVEEKISVVEVVFQPVEKEDTTEESSTSTTTTVEEKKSEPAKTETSNENEDDNETTPSTTEGYSLDDFDGTDTTVEELEALFPGSDEPPQIEYKGKLSDLSDIVGLREQSTTEYSPISTFSLSNGVADKNAYIVKGGNVNYGGWFTHYFTADGHTAFCAEPNVTSPNTGTYAAYEIDNNNVLRTAILCAPGGPLDGRIDGFPHGSIYYDTNPSVVNGNMYPNAHATIGYLYTGSLAGLSPSYSQGIRNMAQLATNVANNTGGGWGGGYGVNNLSDYRCYIAVNGQQDIVWCEYAPREGYATLKKTSANTSLTSGNGNYSLAGAEYGVYSDAGCTQGVGTLTTRADGTSNTLKLKQGTYYVRENKAPTGYILDQTVRSITVTSGQTATLNVSDPPKTVEISLTKKSDNPEVTDNNQLYSLEGAEYSIYKDEACTQYVNKMVTDEDGLASIDGLALNIYYVKETKASPGYGLDTKVYKLDARSGSANVIEVSVESKEVALMDPVGLLLQKVDAETGTAVPVDEGTLQDAQFEVKLYDTFMTTDPGDAGFEPVWSAVMRTDDHGEMWLLNSYVVSGDHVYTDSKGVQSLPFGTITFKEIKSPNGYLINDEVIVQQIRGEDGGVTTVPQYTEPTQEEQPMTLKIIKVQNGTTLPIPEAEFEWVLPDGSNHTYSTDENGEVFFKGLEWGKHTITEVKVPDGYSVNKNKITFTVNQDNTITDASGATVTDTDGNFTLVIDEDNLNPTVTYENKPAPFDLHVYKINDVDFALEGAEFTVYTDEECTDVWKVGKTDTNGDLTFEDLIVGKTYYMKETKAPQGYRIPINEDGSDIVYKIMVTSTPVKDQFTFYVNDKPYTTSSNGMFTVTGTKADRICNITVINERGKQLPETGSSMMLVFLAAGIALMGGAVVASQTRKLSNKRR